MYFCVKILNSSRQSGSIMVPFNLPPPQPSLSVYHTGFKGIFLASLYIDTWIEIHMQII